MSLTKDQAETIVKLIAPFMTAEQLIQLRPLSKGMKTIVDKALLSIKGGPSTMLAKYKGEQLTKTPVIYFDEKQREKFKLTIDEKGHFYLGEKAFTSGDKSQVSPLGQRFHLFALAMDGTFYVHTKLPTLIHHSSMLAGGNVICAGFLSIQNGKLEAIYNSSGHYLPDVLAVLQMINHLMIKGIKPDSYAVKYEMPNTYKPLNFSTASIFIDSIPVSLQLLARQITPLLYLK